MIKRIYYKERVELDSSLRKEIRLPYGDFIDVIDTNSDLSKVLISVDNGDYVQLLNFLPAIFKRQVSIIRLVWDGSQVGKYIEFIIGGEYSYLKQTQYITIINDLYDISSRIRYGRKTSVRWIYSGVVSNVQPNTRILSVNIQSYGYIYGFYIYSTTSDIFRVGWKYNNNDYFVIIPLPSQGVVYNTDFVAINEGMPSNEFYISVDNGNGTYHCGILYGD